MIRGAILFDRITFIIGEAFVALRRNLAMAFAGITTGAIALFLLGSFGLTIVLANDYARSVPNMFDMRIFLNDGTSKEEMKKTVDAIRAFDGVSQVVLFPRDKAWERMQKEQPNLTKGLENPLPDQLRVVVSDLAKGDQIALKIQSMPAVVPEDGVHYLRKEQQMAVILIGGLRVLGPELAILLLAATGVLIYNTIRLTVMSRRLEIRIMQLVGAPDAMVRVPFLIEGAIQGLLAGLCAGGLLLFSVHVFQNQVGANAFQFESLPIQPLMILMSLMGGGYGFLCSVLAVRVPLHFR